jgi:aspartate carbamoyltransferase catalytic subunit
VAIVGDIQHSRVARSNLFGLTKLGAEVTLCGPATLMPVEIERLGCRVTSRLEEAIEGADVIMALRIQLERQRQGRLPSLREYAQLYQLTRERLRIAKPGFIIMHPGPINRGVEIAQDVADGPGSVILDQVTNGVASRMAVLFRASGLDPGALAEGMEEMSGRPTAESREQSPAPSPATTTKPKPAAAGGRR